MKTYRYNFNPRSIYPQHEVVEDIDYQGATRIVAQCESEAEARLLVAAPLMFAALEVARATIQRLTVRHGPFSSADGTLAVIDGAIFSATQGAKHK